MVATVATNAINTSTPINPENDDNVPQLPLLHVSRAVNTTQQALTPLPGSTAFAAACGTLVAIYDFPETNIDVDNIDEPPRVMRCMLPGHKGTVTAIDSCTTPFHLPNTSDHAIIVSASADTTVRVWQRIIADQTQLNRRCYSAQDIPCVATITSHKSPLTAVAVTPLFTTRDEGGAFLIASSSSDGIINMTALYPPNANNTKWSTTLLHTIDLQARRRPCIALCVHFIALGNNNNNNDKPQQITASCLPLLAIGATDHTVMLFSGSLTNNQSESTDINIPNLTLSYREATVLRGHTNWVRSLDSVQLRQSETNNNNNLEGEILVASGSQDRYIRVWKLTWKLRYPIDVTPVDHNNDSKEVATTTTNSKDGFHISFDPSATAAEVEEQLARVLADAGLGGDECDDTIDDTTQSTRRSATKTAQLGTRTHVFDVVVEGNNENGCMPRLEVTALLDTVLSGHDDWVHSVRWFVPQSQSKETHRLLLVSASADKTVAIWRPAQGSNTADDDDDDDKDNSGSISKTRDAQLWEVADRLGNMGGHTLGFCHAVLDDTSLSNINDNNDSTTRLLAVGYGGAIEVWTRQTINSVWCSAPGCGGHSSSAESVIWDPTSRFVISVGLDKTTRAIAPWRTRYGEDKLIPSKSATWHEVARPQIHGYGVRCASFAGSNELLTGSDEKVLRVFAVPKSFRVRLRAITGPADNAIGNNEDDDDDIYDCDDDNMDKDNNGREEADGAAVPALGLSNKAVRVTRVRKPVTSNTDGVVNNKDNDDDDDAPNAYAAAGSVRQKQKVTTPPTEDALLQHTLWPETGKLYGHGHELVAVAAQRDVRSGGATAVTSARATHATDAGVRVWRRGAEKEATWQALADDRGLQTQLAGHTLTVAGLAMRGSRVLSFGRDRGVVVSEIGDGYSSTMRGMCARAHARVIWGGAMLRSVDMKEDITLDTTVVEDSNDNDDNGEDDEDVFATCSRDRTVRVWTLRSGEVHETARWTAPCGATALAAARRRDGGAVLAVGLEDGNVVLLAVTRAVVRVAGVLCDGNKHADAVRSVAFARKGALLATSGADGCVRVFAAHTLA